MLRHLVLAAVALAGLNTIKARVGHSSSLDLQIVEPAAELERRSLMVDEELAAAAGELARHGDEPAYERLAQVAKTVSDDNHEGKTLWRAIERRHRELYAAGDTLQ